MRVLNMMLSYPHSTSDNNGGEQEKDQGFVVVQGRIGLSEVRGRELRTDQAGPPS